MERRFKRLKRRLNELEADNEELEWNNKVLKTDKRYADNRLLLMAENKTKEKKKRRH